MNETLFHCGNAYFEALLEDIERATDSLDIEVYSYYKDALGQRLASALEQASNRGVRVRLLVDGVGTALWGGQFVHRLEQAGIETKIYHPLPWGLWQWGRSVINKPLLTKWLHLLLHINARNHRKVFRIDEAIAYIGSFNVDQRHLPRERGGMAWRDTGVRLEGVDLGELQTAFEHIWDTQPKDVPERIRHWFDSVDYRQSIRLNDGRHRRRLWYKNLLRRLAKARQRIWITNAYFVPDGFLLKKLKDAAERGCDVRILLPRRSDVTIMPWASSTFYRSLIQAGVRIFEYLPSMLHAKTLILDDWVMVGTSNLNHRSLLHDLEVDVVLTDPSNIERAIAQFRHDLTQADEVARVFARPWLQRLIGRLCLYLRYLI